MSHTPSVQPVSSSDGNYRSDFECIERHSCGFGCDALGECKVCTGHPSGLNLRGTIGRGQIQAKMSARCIKLIKHFTGREHDITTP
jgi:hypothetical protein